METRKSICIQRYISRSIEMNNSDDDMEKKTINYLIIIIDLWKSIQNKVQSMSTYEKPE